MKVTPIATVVYMQNIRTAGKAVKYPHPKDNTSVKTVIVIETAASPEANDIRSLTGIFLSILCNADIIKKVLSKRTAEKKTGLK